MAGRLHEDWKRAKAAVPGLEKKIKFHDSYGGELDELDSLITQAKVQAQDLHMTIDALIRAAAKAQLTADSYTKKFEEAVKQNLIGAKDETRLLEGLKQLGPMYYRRALPELAKVITFLH
jgi:hypothetical protein